MGTALRGLSKTRGFRGCCSAARLGRGLISYLKINIYVRGFCAFCPVIPFSSLPRAVLRGVEEAGFGCDGRKGEFFLRLLDINTPCGPVCLSVQAAQAHRTGSPCTAARTGAGQGTFFPSHKNLPVPQQDEPEPSPSFWSCFLKKQAVCNPAVRVCPSFPINS